MASKSEELSNEDLRQLYKKIIKRNVPLMKYNNRTWLLEKILGEGGHEAINKYFSEKAAGEEHRGREEELRRKEEEARREEELRRKEEEARREEELRRQKAEETRKTSEQCILEKTLEQHGKIKYTAVRLEMKNDALSGPETAGGTRCTVDCYKFELYDGPHPVTIISATATNDARPQDTINDLVNGTGRKRWCALARLHEVQSATFVLEKSSTITDVAITTSGQPWRGNTRHTLSRLIGTVGDGHEWVILDWTDAPSKGGKFKLSTQPAKVVETFDLTREGEITHLAVHKDSIISVHRGYTIKQWTLEGRCIRTLKQPAHPYGRVSATAFAVHKGTIICAGKNRKIGVMPIRKGKRLVLRGHSSRVRALAVHKNTIISGSYKTIKLWTFRTGRCIGTLKGHSGWISALAVHEDTIISGSWDKTIKLWTLEGECVRTLEGHLGAVNALAGHKDTIISGSGDHTIKLWTPQGECIRTLEGHSNRISALALHKDTIISSSWDKTIKIWSLKGECIRTLEGHSKRVSALAVHKNTIISGSRDKTIKLWFQ
eukprot:g2753.t1